MSTLLFRIRGVCHIHAGFRYIGSRRVSFFRDINDAQIFHVLGSGSRAAAIASRSSAMRIRQTFLTRMRRWDWSKRLGDDRSRLWRGGFGCDLRNHAILTTKDLFNAFLEINTLRETIEISLNAFDVQQTLKAAAAMYNSVFQLFAAAEPSANVCVALGTPCNDPSVYIATTA